LNYLEIFVEQLFSKSHLNASESAKKHFFCDVTIVENFDKKGLTWIKAAGSV
jgi:hypothetical protein